MSEWDVTKITYNEGDRISSITNPIWDEKHEFSGVPIVNTYIPCGYWSKNYVSTSTPIVIPTYTVYGCGRNLSSELGSTSLNGYPYAYTIRPLLGVGPSLKVIAGSSRSFSIQSTGMLWGTGLGTAGQLGIGIDQSATEWYLIDVSIWSNIITGGSFTLGIKDDNTLWGTGSNVYGRLGMLESVAGVGEFTALLGGAVTVAMANEYETLASSGSTYGTGRNQYGDLGIGSQSASYGFAELPHIFVQMAGGLQHIVGIDTDGKLWGAGRNNVGELGLGPVAYDESPEGFDIERIYTEFEQLSADTWTKVYCGTGCTMALKSDGTLWGTGYNRWGQLGLGHGDQVSYFTQMSPATWIDFSAGYGHTLGIKPDGTVWGTGLNSNYQLGTGYGDTDNRFSFIQLTDGTDWIGVSAGLNHSLFHRTLQ